MNEVNTMNIYDQIAQMAYSIYEKNGKVEGRDLDNWLEAESIVLGQKHQQQRKEPETPMKTKRAAKTSPMRKTARVEKSI
jgi:hypothetical protein